ncbi:MAG TPA: acyl-CoA dehydrogenase, partial [Chryseolinea sp.]
IPDFGAAEDAGIFAKEKRALANLKKAGLMVAGAAVQKYMMKLSEEQEVLMNLADILIECYVAESTILRVQKIISTEGEQNAAIQKEIAFIYLHYAMEKAAAAAKHAIMAFAEGDELRLMLLGLKRFTKIDAYNLKEARRKVANYVIEKGEYPF